MVIVFCGIPGSGKSTIAKALAKELKKQGQVKLFVSDKIRGKVYDKTLKFLEENLGRADFLLLDATFYKEKWREKVFKRVGRENALLIYLDCALETCLKRNKARRSEIPTRAVHILYHQMERPKKPDLILNTKRIEPEKAVKMILEKLKKPLTGVLG